MGSLKTREEIQRDYKRQLQVRDPDCAAEDLQRKWHFVAWQYDRAESLSRVIRYHGPPETERRGSEESRMILGPSWCSGRKV